MVWSQNLESPPAVQNMILAKAGSERNCEATPVAIGERDFITRFDEWRDSNLQY